MFDVVNIQNIIEYPFTAICGEFTGEDIEHAVLEVYEVFLRFIYRFDTKLKGNIFCEALGDLSDNSAADLISVIWID